MTKGADSIERIRSILATSENPHTEILNLATSALARVNSNAGHNTYLWRNEVWTLSEAERVSASTQSSHDLIQGHAPLLFGIPVSVKDCFDLSGSPTSCGTSFYRDLNGIAQHDSWLVETLRNAGAIITGKTHLHPLAYGITGENPDFGDCMQPGNPTALTGGSSSGAAASVMEGSAMAAIGTDTGGSIRVPAALCGLAGYRASIGRGDWRGGAHLAESFDTMGWLFRDLEDTQLLSSFFSDKASVESPLPTTFAIPEEVFLHDCDPVVLASLQRARAELEALGLTATTIPVDWWHAAVEIFAPIQASEAAGYHRGHFAHFESSIRQRLEWGASLSSEEIAVLRQRHAEFRHRMDLLLAEHQLLLMPAAPVLQLTAGADHTQTRARLLRYTAPVSLAGMPAVTIPFFANGKPSGGMQLVAAREDDARLAALAASIGRQRKSMMQA